MEINLAFDAPLQIRCKFDQLVPKIKVDKNIAEFEYEWKVNCVAREVINLELIDKALGAAELEDIRGYD